MNIKMNILKLLGVGALMACVAQTASAEEKAIFNFAQGYATVAHAVFEDAYVSAKNLDKTINQFIETPSESHLMQAQQAWRNARIPYLQSEVYRFGNAIVDDWEGQLNAWPLDEGLIDYVSSQYSHEHGNVGAKANIIAIKSLQVGHKALDLAHITPDLLASLNELGGSEANIATGYHAIEFLLWGQDLHGTGPGAGERPYTDYVQGQECTNGHCDRRAAYLQAASELLISDLDNMVGQWAPHQPDNYRAHLLSLPQKEVLTRALYGMGSLSFGELAGERMKVALEAQSPEDEQDCFSDNTHFSHFYNSQGVSNVYLGQYTRLDGSQVKAVGVTHLVKKKNAELDSTMKAALDMTQAQLQAMVDVAMGDQSMKFDQMIAPGNIKGRTIITDAMQALVVQTQVIEKVATGLDIQNLSPDTADHRF